MDWIEKISEKIKKKIKDLSMKKALVFYMLLCIGCVIILTAITQSVLEQWDSFIWSQYFPTDLGEMNALVVYNDDYSKFTAMDRILVELIDLLQTWSPIIYSILGLMEASYLFYNNKLKEPLVILKEATDKVGHNNLDIELYYDKKDEMGDLCQSFDLMRKQLISNNRKMWDMMEEQKRLNAAFAHDLRTPLTVLRGYTDLLSQYVPEGKISEDKLISTLMMMSDQIKRLEIYSNTMKEINSLEELPMNPNPVDIMELEKKLREVVNVLEGKNQIHIKLLNTVFDYNTRLSLDDAIIMEVFENLMTNALRYATSEVEVLLSLSEDGQQLLLSVADDGKGFSKTDLTMATKPFYTDQGGNKSDHYGIGLYICRLLCEKHQGGITLENRINKGAIITAAFKAPEHVY